MRKFMGNDGHRNIVIIFSKHLRVQINISILSNFSSLTSKSFSFMDWSKSIFIKVN